MASGKRLASLWRNWFRKSRTESDLDAEVRSYVEHLAAEKIAAGMLPEEAHRAARVELGGAEQVKERVREVRAGWWLDPFTQDVRYGLRILRKSPGFTAVAVLTIALGVGANSAIFSVVNAVLLRPLPLDQPERLVAMWQTYPQRNLTRWMMSLANFAAYREHASSFEELAAWTWVGYTLTGAGEPVRLQAGNVTANFFHVLGVRPHLGRDFLPGEDAAGRNQVCILSHGLWLRRFGGDLAAIGKKILLNDVPHEIVGVLPAGLPYPNPAIQLWVPLALDPQRTAPFFLRGIARLKPGIAAPEAKAECTRVLRNLSRDNAQFAGSNAPPPPEADLATVVTPLHEAVTGQSRAPLLVLLGAVGLVLLVACANVANLLLARATARGREISVRLALGATAGRMARQLLAESLLLGLLGGIAGWALAVLALGLLDWLPADAIPRAQEVSVDGAVLAFTLAVVVLATLLFGLAPALRAYRLGIATGLQGSARGTATRSHRRTNGTLVALQFALSLVLLVGTGLLLRSFERLLAVDPGFDPENLLTLRLYLSPQKYPEGWQSAQFYRSLSERVRALPGVRAAAVVSNLPFTGDLESDGTVVEGHEPPAGEMAPITFICRVGPDYFRAMGIALRRGREFAQGDDADSLPVAIVDETLARRYAPDGNLIGRRIRFSWDTDNPTWLTIVGVVGGVRDSTLAHPREPHLYLAHGQDPLRRMSLVVRAEGDAGALAPQIRATLRKMDPDVPAFAVQTMQENIGETLAQRKFTGGLLTAFAAMALLLAAVGIYGVMSLDVAGRFRELGIRMALGAQRRQVFAQVVGQGARLAAIGLAAGVAAALALTRLLEDLLFEVTPYDPVTLAGAALILAAVALAGCALPAQRATRVDPIAALRHE